MSLWRELKAQFLQRDSRDQVMLLVLLGAVLLYLLYYVLLQPLSRQLAEQQGQLAALQASHSRVKNLAARVINTNNSHPLRAGASHSLTQQVDQALREQGLTLQGLQSGANGEVRLRLQEVEYAKLLQWLYVMEVEQGVQVVNLTVVAGKNEGRVIANLVLRQGAGS